MVAGEDADNVGDRTIVDDKTDCNIEIGEALADIEIVDAAITKTADLAKYVADVFIVGEAMECIAEKAEMMIEESGVEVAIDCTVEGVDVVSGTEVARIVEFTIVDKAAIVEDDVGSVLVEMETPRDMARTVGRTVGVEDGTGTALDERLSALMMSAAFARILES